MSPATACVATFQGDAMKTLNKTAAVLALLLICLLSCDAQTPTSAQLRQRPVVGNNVKTARGGPPPLEGTIIGNKKSKKYRRPDCPGYRNMAERNRVFFRSVAEAEGAGYKRAG